MCNGISECTEDVEVSGLALSDGSGKLACLD